MQLLLEIVPIAKGCPLKKRLCFGVGAHSFGIPKTPPLPRKTLKPPNPNRNDTRPQFPASAQNEEWSSDLNKQSLNSKPQNPQILKP